MQTNTPQKRTGFRRQKKHFTEAFKELQRRAWKYSRGMKHKPTKAEKALADALTAHGIAFKQQGYFFTDDSFYIPDFRLSTDHYKLIVEVDGPSHTKEVEYDEKRTLWLAEKHHCLVIRFTNEEVLADVEAVIQNILLHHPKMREEIQRNQAISLPPSVLAEEWSFANWHFRA